MLRFIILVSALLFTGLTYGQGFPDAQKQPKLKESRANHRHFAHQARRRHIKKGTAYLPVNDLLNIQPPVYILSDNRRRLTVA